MSGPTGRKMNRARIVGIMRYLMMQPRTKAQLQKFAGISRTTANDWMNELHRAGCVHISGYVLNPRSGYQAGIFAWGCREDALKPAPTTSAQRVRKCRNKVTLENVWRQPELASSRLPVAPFDGRRSRDRAHSDTVSGEAA